jgi:hypothetical protein
MTRCTERHTLEDAFGADGEGQKSMPKGAQQ